MLAYEATRKALFHPEQRDSLFRQRTAPSLDALCAECARLAYLPFERDDEARRRLEADLSLAGFGSPASFDHADTGTQAWAALRAVDGLAIVAFRGTEPLDPGDFGAFRFGALDSWGSRMILSGGLRDLITDIDIDLRPGEAAGRVHKGFRDGFAGVAPGIGDWLAGSAARKLVVTGHSLGGALATVAAVHWHRLVSTHGLELVSFGAPRAGDRAFAAAAAGIPARRYVDCADLVPCLPPELPGVDYRHVGTRRYIDRHGRMLGEVADTVADVDRASARWRYWFGPGFGFDRVPSRELADHAPINYIRALWAKEA